MRRISIGFVHSESFVTAFSQASESLSQSMGASPWGTSGAPGSSLSQASHKPLTSLSQASPKALETCESLGRGLQLRASRNSGRSGSLWGASGSVWEQPLTTLSQAPRLSSLSQAFHKPFTNLSHASHKPLTRLSRRVFEWDCFCSIGFLLLE